MREGYEHLWGIKEDKVLELQELISTWLFRIIITSAKEVEFKMRKWEKRVAVFLNGEFECNISKEDAMQFIDDDSILNTQFAISKKGEEQTPIEVEPPKESSMDYVRNLFDEEIANGER